MFQKREGTLARSLSCQKDIQFLVRFNSILFYYGFVRKKGMSLRDVECVSVSFDVEGFLVVSLLTGETDVIVLCR